MPSASRWHWIDDRTAARKALARSAEFHDSRGTNGSASQGTGQTYPAGSNVMKARKPIRSEMGWSTIDKIVVRGHDLPNELIGQIDLGSMAFLEIMGRRPTVREADVFNALLVTLVEHGMTPQAIATRMISAAAPEALQAAAAAGFGGGGGGLPGGPGQGAKILQEALKDSPGADDLGKIAADIV